MKSALQIWEDKFFYELKKGPDILGKKYDNPEMAHISAKAYYDRLKSIEHELNIASHKHAEERKYE